MSSIEAAAAAALVSDAVTRARADEVAVSLAVVDEAGSLVAFQRPAGLRPQLRCARRLLPRPRRRTDLQRVSGATAHGEEVLAMEVVEAAADFETVANS